MRLRFFSVLLSAALPAWAALPDDAPTADDAPAGEAADAGTLSSPESLVVPFADAGVVVALPTASATVLAPSPEPGVVSFVNKPKRTNYLIPALESEALHLLFLSFTNLVSRESFGQVSLDSIKSHFDGRRPWTWDVDYFLTNQFGHPYQGALAFTAARSSGVPFWLATLYPLFASLTWELFYEVDAPSINDQITTTIGGIFLGEVLHRAAMLVLTDTDGRAPGWGRKLGSFLLSPMDTANSWLTNDDLYAGDLEDHPPYFAIMGAGVTFGSSLREPATGRVFQTAGTQLNLQGRLTYGIPGDPDFKYRHPFSHFDLDFNLSVGGGSTAGAYFSRGLLFGTSFGSANTSVRGLWGLFGQYDYSGVSLVRVSSVGVGIGTSLQWKLSQNVFLQTSGVFSGVPFATAGALGLDEELYRDYHIGPGVQLALDARLIHKNVGWLRVSVRDWFVVGAYTPPSGWENIMYFTVGPMVRLLGPVALGADMVVAVRRSAFEDQTLDRSVTGFTARLSLVWLSDWKFGVVDRQLRPGPQPTARR
ncbi:MAG: hypothetical protein AMXMBFR34_01930 [Myxococcaceae bacterium]